MIKAVERTKRAGLAGLALMLVAAPAMAADDAVKFSWNLGVTSDYVFRGFSQTREKAAVQGGVDLTKGIFYAGAWASSLDFRGASDFFGRPFDSDVELDIYAGIKPVWGRFTFDLGVIGYTYPSTSGNASNLNYFELKAGYSFEPWKDATLGSTVFFSPDYTLETGNVWTLESSFAQVLPKIGPFSPTFSALLGYQKGSDAAYRALVGNGDRDYYYWNAGISLGFLEKFSLDLRYWDTNLTSNAGGAAFCKGTVFQCDERFVATLKVTY
jgi:uncharacterized protein (TIGR02001 family)